MSIIRDIRPLLKSCLEADKDYLFASRIEQIYDILETKILRHSLDVDIEKESATLNRHLGDFSAKVKEINSKVKDEFGLAQVPGVSLFSFTKNEETYEFRRRLFSDRDLKGLIGELVKDIEQLLKKE